jgi:hypothetical protein
MRFPASQHDCMGAEAWAARRVLALTLPATGYLTAHLLAPASSSAGSPGGNSPVSFKPMMRTKFAGVGGRCDVTHAAAIRRSERHWRHPHRGQRNWTIGQNLREGDRALPSRVGLRPK